MKQKKRRLRKKYFSDGSKLDKEVARILNARPYSIPVKRDRYDGGFQREGRYTFGEGEKGRLVTCRLTGPHLVVVRVGGGWEQLEQFLANHPEWERRLE